MWLVRKRQLKPSCEHANAHENAQTLFLAHSVSATQLFYFLKMQMDAYFEKEQIGTLFVRGGAVLGGVWG